MRHWYPLYLCLVSSLPCIIFLGVTLYSFAVLRDFFSFFILCVYAMTFIFSSLLSNAQRARTVCIMYCIQPRKDMMNSKQSRPVPIDSSVHSQNAPLADSTAAACRTVAHLLTYHHDDYIPAGQTPLVMHPPHVRSGEARCRSRDSKHALLRSLLTCADLMILGVLAHRMFTWTGLRISPLAEYHWPRSDVIAGD